MTGASGDLATLYSWHGGPAPAFFRCCCRVPEREVLRFFLVLLPPFAELSLSSIFSGCSFGHLTEQCFYIQDLGIHSKPSSSTRCTPGSREGRRDPGSPPKKMLPVWQTSPAAARDSRRRL